MTESNHIFYKNPPQVKIKIQKLAKIITFKFILKFNHLFLCVLLFRNVFLTYWKHKTKKCKSPRGKNVEIKVFSFFY